jgi:hypothetical protein
MLNFGFMVSFQSIQQSSKAGRNLALFAWLKNEPLFVIWDITQGLI